MLLIGSRAAKYHFPFSRKPKDYDFIASEVEVREFLSHFKHQDVSTHPKKIRARVELDRPTSFEFELTDTGATASSICYRRGHTDFEDSKLNTSYQIASPKILFLLKKSHICFNIHWKKNICDYLFLKERVDPKEFDENWEELFNQRFEETKARVKFKDRNFDVDNSEFFKVSEAMVKRQLPHDNIHYATCFYNRPLFMEVKDDLSRAEMNPEKVFKLSHEDQIKLIQEECMALAIERYILPCVKENKPFDARQAYVDTAARMVYNYLPMFLKFFAADNFMEIIHLQVDYVARFFENVKGLELPDENIQVATRTNRSLQGMSSLSY